jgi:hypothetical protein
MMLAACMLVSVPVLGSEPRYELRDLFAEYGREARSLVRDEWGFYLQNYADQAVAREVGEPGSDWLLQSRLSEAMRGQGKAFMDRRQALAEQADALIRQSSDEQLIDLLRSGDTLAVSQFLSNSMLSFGDPSEDSGTQADRQRLRGLFESSPELQQVLIDLWWDDRPYLGFLFSTDKVADYAERLQVDRAEMFGPSLGASMTGVVFSAVPREALLAVLDDAIAAWGTVSLPRHVEDLIENGVLASFLDLSPAWLAERVEGGQMIWLNSLAIRDPDGRFAVIDEHIDRLSLDQQLRIIQSRPDPDSIDILRAAWHQAMDDLGCQGCTPSDDAVDRMDLVGALVAMPGQEVAEMLVELFELQRIAGEGVGDGASGIVSSMLFSNNEAVLSAGLELALDEDASPLPMMGLKRLHAANADAFQALVARRLDRFEAMSPADREELLAGPIACQFSALSLYARLSDMPSTWPGTMERHRDLARSPDSCASLFIDVLSIESMTASGLDAVLAVYLSGDEPLASVSNFIVNLRYRDTGLRDDLAERLIASPIWDRLDPDHRDWLLGVQSSGLSELSCEGDLPSKA